MLKVAYFSNTESSLLQNSVNEFLKSDIEVLSVIPFGTKVYARCQVLYRVPGPGSRLVEAPTQRPSVYVEEDRLDIPRSE